MKRNEYQSVAHAMECINLRREHAGLSSAEIARRLDLSQPYVFNVLTGKQPCELRVAQRFADVVGMKIRIVMEGKK